MPNTLQRFNKDWKSISQSRKTREELQVMIAAHAKLQGLTPQEIFNLVGNTKNISHEKRDPVLTALFDLVNKSELAARLILQSLQPQIGYLVRITNFADPEERAATILSIAAERIMLWRPKSDRFCHLKLYFSIYRRTMNVAKQWNRWEGEIDDSESVDGSVMPDATSHPTSLDTLINWVANFGKVNQQTAEMVVLTRGGYSTIGHFSKDSGISQQTLRQRRLRAEDNIKNYFSRTGQSIAWL